MGFFRNIKESLVHEETSTAKLRVAVKACWRWSSWSPGGCGDHGGLDVHGDGGGGAAVRPPLRQDPGDLQAAEAGARHRETPPGRARRHLLQIQVTRDLGSALLQNHMLCPPMAVLTINMKYHGIWETWPWLHVLWLNTVTEMRNFAKVWEGYGGWGWLRLW